MSDRLLIAFGSRYGQTENIAVRIAERLREAGYQVELVDILRAGTPSLPLADYRGVIVGSGIYMEKHLPEAQRWIEARLENLRTMPSAFFSVSGDAGGSAADREKAKDYVHKFIVDVGWKPAVTAAIGGAIVMPKYPLPLRLVMWFIAKRRGAQVGWSETRVNTDWNSVDDFAAGCIELLKRRRSLQAVS